MYAAAFTQALNSLRQAVANVCGVYEDSLFFHNLLEFYRLEPKTRSAGTVRIAPEDVARIEVQGVCFRYPGTQRCAVENLNITFRRSESTLLVGTNGAGKTTLIKLLMRLYDPDAGRVLINGTDIREFERLFLHQLVGVIFQDCTRFAVSAGENIGYGFIEEWANQERIQQAAKMARAETIINGLPRKYDTLLGKMFRHGQELAQGQWQRICLARLFMKNAPVLILDEPTAGLVDQQILAYHFSPPCSCLTGSCEKPLVRALGGVSILPSSETGNRVIVSHLTAGPLSTILLPVGDIRYEGTRDPNPGLRKQSCWQKTQVAACPFGANAIASLHTTGVLLDV